MCCCSSIIRSFSIHSFDFNRCLASCWSNETEILLVSSVIIDLSFDWNIHHCLYTKRIRIQMVLSISIYVFDCDCTVYLVVRITRKSYINFSRQSNKNPITNSFTSIFYSNNNNNNNNNNNSNDNWWYQWFEWNTCWGIHSNATSSTNH